MGIVALIFFVTLLGLVPTYFLLRWERANVIETIAIISATGFSILSVAALIGYWFELHLSWMLPIAIILSIIASFMVWELSKLNPLSIQRPAWGVSGLIEPVTGWQLLALAMIATTAIIAAIVGTIDILSSDTIHHLASQKRFLDSPHFTSDNFILSRSFPYDIVYEAYAGNTFSPLFAELSRLSGADIGETFIHFNGLSYAMVSCATFMLSRRAFRGISHSKGELEGVCALALLGTYFFTCRLGNYTGSPDMSWVSYPSVFTMSVVFVGLALFVDVRDKKQAAPVVIACLTFAGALGFHLQWLLVIAVCMLVFAVMRIPQAIRDGAIVAVLSFGVAVALALVVGLSSRMAPLGRVSAGGQSTWDQWPNPSYYTHSIFGRAISFDAFCTKDIIGLLACFVLFAVLIWRARRSRQPIGTIWQVPAAWIAAIPIVFYIIFFCAPVTALVLHFVPQPVVLRIFWFTDVLLILCAGWAVAFVLMDVGGMISTPMRWLLRGVVTFSLIGIFFAAYRSQGENLYLIEQGEQSAGYLGYENVIKDSDLPRLLSILKSSDVVLILQRGPAASKNVEFDLAPIRMAQPTYALGPAEKKIADQFVIDKNTSSEHLAQLMKKYDVTYVTSWIWPGQTTDLVEGKAGLVLAGESHIRRPGLQDVVVKLYRVVSARQ